MTRKESFAKDLEEWKKFFKEDEDGYLEDVAKKTITTLKMEYYGFKLALEENIRDLDEVYNDYMGNDIDNIMLNYEVTAAKIHIDHRQNMVEIVVKELLKRAA